MFRDDSSGATTSISPCDIDPTPWRFSSIPRQRAIIEKGQWEFSFGPAAFELCFNGSEKQWWNNNSLEKKVLAERKVPADCFDTILKPTLPPTRYQTRVQSPRVPESKLRDTVIYYPLQNLGSGSFGQVTRVLNLQWGGILAMKVVVVAPENQKRIKEGLKKEVELLAKLTHPHIIEYKHSQGWELGKDILIFMAAADKSLRNLISRQFSRSDITIMAQQIAQAIKYLHERRIIHRDIKPENILYKRLYRTRPIFFLTDFGLSKEINANRSFVGTYLYLAPEIWTRAKQGLEVDIWSFASEL